MTQETNDNSYPTLYCANHPQRPTLLRCNRCEKPICSDCAVKTPVGYRCKECVRGQQKVYDTAKKWDYPVAFLVAAIIAFLGSFTTAIGFFTIFLTPIIGVLAAEAVRWATRRRRSPALHKITSLAVGLGSLPLVMFQVINTVLALADGYGLWYAIGPMMWQGIYLILIITTVYYRLSGKG